MYRRRVRRWSLDPREVFCRSGGGIGKRKGHPAVTTRRLTVSLVHLPTGVSVTGQNAVVRTRAEARAFEREQYQILFPILEAAVAKHLRIRGR
jgi:hypothetical protein